MWIDIRILAEPVYRPVLIEHLKSATAEMGDVEVEPRREMARELSILPRQQAVTAVRGRSMRKDHLICVVPSAVLPMYIADRKMAFWTASRLSRLRLTLRERDHTSLTECWAENAVSGSRSGELMYGRILSRQHSSKTKTSSTAVRNSGCPYRPDSPRGNHVARWDLDFNSTNLGRSSSRSCARRR